MARHHQEEEGGEQELDQLLSSHRDQLLVDFEDIDPIGPPDPERWPHRVHSIPERAWKRWLSALSDALGDQYTLMEHGLVACALLDPARPRLAICAYDEYGDEGNEPEIDTEGARALAQALLDRLGVPQDALVPPAQIFAGRFDKVGKRMYNVRVSLQAQGPSIEARLDEHHRALIEALESYYLPDVPDPDLWPHRAREIEDDTWWDWLDAIDSTLDDFNDELTDLEVAMLLVFHRRRGPELVLRDLEDEPLRGPAARRLCQAALETMRVPRPALEMLLATRGEAIERACRKLSFVQVEE